MGIVTNHITEIPSVILLFIATYVCHAGCILKAPRFFCVNSRLLNGKERLFTQNVDFLSPFHFVLFAINAVTFSF